MSYRSQSVGDVKSITKLHELQIVKLMLVVDDDCSEQVKSANDRLSYKIMNLGLSDSRQCFHFHPFGEVVDRDQ